ncbi:MAG: hypothetical protein EWV85_24585 [Microcystis aeruginosa Ma_QC_C_20070703_M131]|uniref:Uncharacterized protein n=1 Tax=Microcystis aeruginosa Ma_QC_C_20070703_M131 TaxID=2486263 RepID=A0A551X217_MICAE|nr:MAG: hypothetical protein EWV85_24585 [Microcystis aeruginosa Ma_QC_C_20070703_M131]
MSGNLSPHRLSVISYQLSVISYQLSDVSFKLISYLVIRCKLISYLVIYLFSSLSLFTDY